MCVHVNTSNLFQQMSEKGMEDPVEDRHMRLSLYQFLSFYSIYISYLFELIDLQLIRIFLLYQFHAPISNSGSDMEQDYGM